MTSDLEEPTSGRSPGDAIAKPGLIRSRAVQALASLIVIGLGLLSRSHRIGLPKFWEKYAGSALWGLMVFLLFGMLFPRRSTRFVGMVALVYSCATEFSQLYHAPWIDAIRRNALGHLVLGDTFSWSDIAAYAAGILIGMGVEVILYRRQRLMSPNSLATSPSGTRKDANRHF